MASPGGYFAGGPSDISGIFQQIAQSICGVTLTKTLTGADPAIVGEAVTFDVVVTNNGAIDIDNVDVHDDYDPAYLDFVSASPAQTSVNEATGDIDWNNLAHSPADGDPAVWEPGATRTITLNFTALLPVTVTENCAGVTAEPVSDGIVLQFQRLR